MTESWITSWIEPSSSPAVTGRCYHPTERAAELFARTLVHRGVRNVVVFLGPANHTEGDVA
jgi:hypothetical protein